MATGGPSGTVSSRQTKRIQDDLQLLKANPLPFIRDLQLSVVDNINELTGVMVGPQNSDYAGGHFRFLIRCPPEYPFKPPEFFFITAICHPNSDSRTGTACHDQLLATWSPNIKLSKLLNDMHGLLAKPNYDVPLEGDSLVDKSPEKARQWTQQFAIPTNQ
jgi:ubiquitin-protein ligase